MHLVGNWVKGNIGNLSFGDWLSVLRVPNSLVFGTVKLTYLAVKIAEKPWSQSWQIDIRFRLTKSGNTLDCWAPIGSWGKA